MKPSPRVGDRVRIPGWILRQENDVFGMITKIDRGYYYITSEDDLDEIVAQITDFDIVSR
jgi:hypothetical protein